MQPNICQSYVLVQIDKELKFMNMIFLIYFFLMMMSCTVDSKTAALLT